MNPSRILYLALTIGVITTGCEPIPSESRASDPPNAHVAHGAVDNPNVISGNAQPSSESGVSHTAAQSDSESLICEEPITHTAGGPTEPSPTSPAAVTPPPAATGSLELKTSLSNTHVLMPGNGEVHLSIELKAGELEDMERLPMNIALVIDRSGSMRGEKMEQTRAAARHLVSQLKEADTLSIVSYASDVRIDLSASRLTEDVRQTALDAISRIRPGGSTNLSGGLFLGQAEIERNLKTGQVNRVILMSDGLANRGITDTNALSQQAQKTAQGGISVSTMGIGVDYNEDLMTALADHASGNYYFIQSADQIASVFGQELQRMFATVAQAVKVRVLIEDGIDLVDVHGYTFTREGDAIQIPLAEMFAEQRRSILMTLKAPTHREGMTAVAQVTLNYDDVTREGAQKELESTASVTITRDETLVQNGRNHTVEERLSEVQVAQAMQTAANLLRDGNHGAAQGILNEALVRNQAASRGLGGSARLDRQTTALRQLRVRFEDSAGAPSAAAEAVKSTKASGRALSL